MPTVEFNFGELCSLLRRNYKPKELEDRISMLGVGLENINRESVVMEIFPNRPDLLSIEGFARAMRGFMNIERGIPEYRTEDSGVRLFVDPSVDNIRPYISAAVIKGIRIDEERLKSLMDMQEKLHLTHGRNRKRVAIGIHDMSKIEEPFTYRAIKADKISFIPLDMNERLNLEEILQRHPKGREYSHVFKNAERYPVILDRNKNVLSFPPIINGELTRVTEKTRDLFVEVTGTDQKAVDQALSIITTSLAERGCRIYSVELVRR